LSTVASCGRPWEVCLAARGMSAPCRISALWPTGPQLVLPCGFFGTGCDSLPLQMVCDGEQLLAFRHPDTQLRLLEAQASFQVQCTTPALHARAHHTPTGIFVLFTCTLSLHTHWNHLLAHLHPPVHRGANTPAGVAGTPPALATSAVLLHGPAGDECCASGAQMQSGK
jgi:hypothetical protein